MTEAWSDDFRGADYFGDGSGSTRYVTQKRSGLWIVNFSRLGPGDLLLTEYLPGELSGQWLDPLGTVPDAFTTLEVGVTLSMEPAADGRYGFTFGWFWPSVFPPGDFSSYLGGGNYVAVARGSVDHATGFGYLEAIIGTLSTDGGRTFLPDVDPGVVEQPVGLDLSVPRHLRMTLTAGGLLTAEVDGMPAATVDAPAGGIEAFHAMARAGLIYPFVQVDTNTVGGRVHIHEWHYDFTANPPYPFGAGAGALNSGPAPAAIQHGRIPDTGMGLMRGIL